MTGNLKLQYPHRGPPLLVGQAVCGVTKSLYVGVLRGLQIVEKSCKMYVQTNPTTTLLWLDNPSVC